MSITALYRKQGTTIFPAVALSYRGFTIKPEDYWIWPEVLRATDGFPPCESQHVNLLK
jgi:hypothetical protein